MNRKVDLGQDENWKYLEQHRIIRSMKAKFLLLEQVSSARAADATRKLRGILSDLYVTKSKALDASDYGDGSRKTRLWTIGVRKDIHDAVGDIQWPAPAFKNCKVSLESTITRKGSPKSQKAPVLFDPRLKENQQRVVIPYPITQEIIASHGLACLVCCNSACARLWAVKLAQLRQCYPTDERWICRL